MKKFEKELLFSQVEGETTSEDTEHAIVLINIAPNGTYSAIDPVQDKTIFGSLTDQNIMQLYLIKKQ